jgi:hypothetical protein
MVTIIRQNNAAGTGIDPAVTTTALLQAVPTTGLPLGTIKHWVESATMLNNVDVLKASTDPVADGGVPPDDFNAATNAKGWFRAG